jgi:hypothetical protein
MILLKERIQEQGALCEGNQQNKQADVSANHGE